jgi:hypothetical protein
MGLLGMYSFKNSACVVLASNGFSSVAIGVLE